MRKISLLPLCLIFLSCGAILTVGDEALNFIGGNMRSVKFNSEKQKELEQDINRILIVIEEEEVLPFFDQFLPLFTKSLHEKGVETKVLQLFETATPDEDIDEECSFFKPDIVIEFFSKRNTYDIHKIKTLSRNEVNGLSDPPMTEEVSFFNDINYIFDIYMYLPIEKDVIWLGNLTINTNTQIGIEVTGMRSSEQKIYDEIYKTAYTSSKKIIKDLREKEIIH